MTVQLGQYLFYKLPNIGQFTKYLEIVKSLKVHNFGCSVIASGLAVPSKGKVVIQVGDQG